MLFILKHVLLLVDTFETFRNTCLEHHKLDPAHFYTAPGLEWQALLKIAAEYCGHEKRHKGCKLCPNKFRLELCTDMLLTFEKGIWGGITQAVKRYVKANHKFMREQYNGKEASTYIFSIRMQTTFMDGQ